MADLSSPREAADWARSWFREASNPVALVRYSHAGVVRRVERAIAQFSADPVQATRCADSIAVLRVILRDEVA